MECSCLVFIPHPVGGACAYPVAASSSFEAARLALAEHEKHFPRLGDDAVVHVVVEARAPCVSTTSSTTRGRRTVIGWGGAESRE
jgi:hypothetical protein